MARPLTTGRPWKVVLLFAVPLLVGNVVQQLYGVADAFVVGRLVSVDALAAVGSTGSLSFLLLGFAWGMTSGFAIPTAQAVGAGDAVAVRRSVAAGAWLTGAATVVITTVSLLVARPALELLRTPPELLHDATVFLVVSFAGAGATMFFNFLTAIIRALGDSRTPLVFLTLCCVLNVALVYAFVAGLRLGVAGAALATVVSLLVSVLLCLRHVRRHVPALHVRREEWRVTRAELAQHARIGLPMGLQASVIAIGALVVQLRLNELGADAVAAYTAASRVDGLAVALLGSLGLATSTFVAQNHGAGLPRRIRRGIVESVGLAVVASALLGALLVAFGGHLVTLFVGPGHDDVVSMAHWFLVLNGLLYATLGVLFVLRGALQGLGHTLVPTLSGVLELVARCAAAILLGGAFGFTGVVWSNPAAWAAALVALVPGVVVADRALRRAVARAEDARPAGTRDSGLDVSLDAVAAARETSVAAATGIAGEGGGSAPDLVPPVAPAASVPAPADVVDADLDDRTLAGLDGARVHDREAVARPV